jgi:hypothetical protein
MADDIETRLEQELSERFPRVLEAEIYGVRFAGDPFEIHLQDDGSLGWTHRGGGHGGTSTVNAAVAGEMTAAIRALLDREQWLFNRLVEREREVADLKRQNS